VIKVILTDQPFGVLDIERGILDPLGCELIDAQCKTEQALIPAVADADHIITTFAPLTAAVIAAMGKCRVIVRHGVGVDNVDLAAAAAKGIPVCNVPDYCVDEVADHALAMILDLARKITTHAAVIRAGGWKLATPITAVNPLKELTVGIVAFGRIGREVASRLKPFKCRVLVFDPAVDASEIKAAGFTPARLDELLAQSDVITLHCPSNEKTKQMINEQSIAKMKDGVMLVNTSRGTLVKTDDLIATLQSGKISAAALDVLDPEPAPADSPLRTMDNVILTPHMAAVSAKAVKTLRATAANIVACAIRGEKLPNVVNKVPQRS